MTCANPLNIASTPYVDCVVTTVSGHLQEQISAIVADEIEPSLVSDSSNLVITSGSNVITFSPSATPSFTSVTASSGTFSNSLTVSGIAVQVKSPQVLVVRQSLTNGTTGGSGTSLNTYYQRPLNTVSLNTIPGASLSSDTITLPAGNYTVIGWSVNAFTDLTKPGQCRVIVQDNAYSVVGANNSPAGVGSTGGGRNSVSTVNGSFTHETVHGVFRFEHFQPESNGTDIFGQPTSLGGDPEVYAELIFTKIS